MATAQVKFYAKASLPTENIDENGLYFIQGGELYKGSQRFGLGKVTIASSTAGVTGAERGDIVVTGSGAGWVYAGSEAGWQSIGGDIGTITSTWKADISASLSGLAVGDSNSYITNITQNDDGSVSANAVAFPTFATGDSDGQVKLGTTNAKVSGWDALAGRVSAMESIVIASTATVTAETGNFTNLNVSDTATFSATTVSASTLTVGGSDISVLISAGADARIGAATLSGNISASDGTGLVNEGQVVNYVTAQLSTFDNAMHFIDAGTTLPSSAKAGDVYVFTADATDDSGYKAGQEVVYKGDNGTYSAANWEVIGDQNNYVTTAAFQASWNTLGTAAGKDFANAVDASAETLPTGSAVATYVTSEIQKLDATVSASTSGENPDSNVDVTITESDGKLTGVTANIYWIT